MFAISLFIPTYFMCTYYYVDETLEQANRRLNSVVNDQMQTIVRLKTDNKQLRAENHDLRSSLPVKLEPELCELLSPFQVFYYKSTLHVTVTLFSPYMQYVAQYVNKTEPTP